MKKKISLNWFKNHLFILFHCHRKKWRKLFLFLSLNRNLFYQQFHKIVKKSGVRFWMKKKTQSLNFLIIHNQRSKWWWRKKNIYKFYFFKKKKIIFRAPFVKYTSSQDRVHFENDWVCYLTKLEYKGKKKMMMKKENILHL